MIKCKLEYTGHIELPLKEVELPSIPSEGDCNFDIKLNGEFHSFSVTSVDWYILEGKFDHCTIYLLEEGYRD